MLMRREETYGGDTGMGSSWHCKNMASTFCTLSYRSARGQRTREIKTVMYPQPFPKIAKNAVEWEGTWVQSVGVSGGGY